MNDMHYSEQHEWIRLEDGIGVVGISRYAAKQLGDVVFVELPEVGKAVIGGQEVAVVESVKVASEVFSPASGVICAINTDLANEPGTINQDPEGDGWLFRIELTSPDDLARLMTDAQYQALIAGLEA